MRLLQDKQLSAHTVYDMETISGANEALKADQIDSCKTALSKTTGHNWVEITNNGSEAIYLTLSMIGGTIMLPDQGIWGGTKEHCKQLGIKVHTLKTHLGLVDLEVLRRSLEKHTPNALLITSFTGYIAEQNLMKISKACREQDVLLIEDASASIGDRKLAKGAHADVILGSARAPKLLNLSSGGFITSNTFDLMNGIWESNKRYSPDPVICAGIEGELQTTSKTIDKLTGVAENLKSNLENVVHKDERGICVGARHQNPKRLAKYVRNLGLVTVGGRSIITTCPRFDRFLENGIVIEIKKINPYSLDQPEISRIANIIKEN
jgi:hypothetical protein